MLREKRLITALILARVVHNHRIVSTRRMRTTDARDCPDVMRRPTTVINLLVTALIVAGILTASILTLRAAPRVRKVEAFVGCPAPIQVAVPLALSGLSQFYSRFESVSYKAESDAVAMDE